MVRFIKKPADYSHPSNPQCQKATPSNDGYMAKEDKSKLDGIEENANNYSHPTTLQCNQALKMLNKTGLKLRYGTKSVGSSATVTISGITTIVTAMVCYKQDPYLQDNTRLWVTWSGNVLTIHKASSTAKTVIYWVIGT